MSDILKRNNVQVIGEGAQTVVMAHGFGCDQKMWQYVLPYFKDDYRIVLFDYVGSGNSDITAYDAEKYKDLHGYKQDLLDVIDALELEHVIYFGHSVSSMIGLLASNEQPYRFDKLVMIGPSPRYLNDDNYTGGFEESDIQDLISMMEMNFNGWASYMAPLAMGELEVSCLTTNLEQTFTSINQTVAKQFAEATFYSDCRSDLGKQQHPTLILQCANDSIVPICVGEYLHEHMPNSKLVVVDARGHYPHISQPQKTVDIILNFLQENSKEYSYA